MSKKFNIVDALVEEIANIRKDVLNIKTEVKTFKVKYVEPVNQIEKKANNSMKKLNQIETILKNFNNNNTTKAPTWFENWSNDIYQNQPPAWFEKWNKDVYQKQQPEWFKTWNKDVYQKQQPEWFKTWNKDVYQKQHQNH